MNNQVFKKRGRGYDADQVEAFISELNKNTEKSENDLRFELKRANNEIKRLTDNHNELILKTDFIIRELTNKNEELQELVRQKNGEIEKQKDIVAGLTHERDLLFEKNEESKVEIGGLKKQIDMMDDNNTDFVTRDECDRAMNINFSKASTSETTDEQKSHSGKTKPAAKSKKKKSFIRKLISSMYDE